VEGALAQLLSLILSSSSALEVAVMSCIWPLGLERGSGYCASAAVPWSGSVASSARIVNKESLRAIDWDKDMTSVSFSAS